MSRLRTALPAGAAAGLLAVAGVAIGTQSASAATNLVTNPGFETGTLSDWSCSQGCPSTYQFTSVFNGFTG